MKHRITHRVTPPAESARAAVLRDLLAVAEANHALLMRLMPRMREVDGMRFAVAGMHGQPVEVCIRVLERGPYTTLLGIEELLPAAGWVAPLRATVRLCHDARVAEVTEFHPWRRLWARYAYPNAGMHQPDEKLQVNRYLGEWLQHCLRWGEAREGNSLPA